PSSYGIVNLYAIFGGACLLSLFALSGAFNGGRDQPFGEQCRQSMAVLACIAIIGSGTWYISTSLQHVSHMLDTLLADFMSGSHYRDTIGAGHAIRIAHQRDVKLSRRVVATLSGSRSPVYLRTQVMTRYQNRRWTPALALPPQPLRTRAPQESGHREVRLHVNLRGAVPLPYGAARVHVPEPLSCLQSTGGIVQCSPPSQLTSYTFASSQARVPIPYGIGFAQPVPDAAPSLSTLSQTLQQALSGPEAVFSQLRPIARRITGTDTPHALAAAQQIQQHFRQHFSYSLHVDLSPERDPIVDFVKHRRPAYCEYFASGMALMLRSLGIPARVAGGFLVWEYNSLLQQWIVRQRDAHAWVEVYDDMGQRWVGFDATPAFRQERFSRTGLAGFLHQSRAWAELQVRTGVKKIYQIDFIAWFMRLRQLKTRFGPAAVRGLVLAVLIVSAYWLWRRFFPSMYRWWKHLRWPVRRRPFHASEPLQAEAQQYFAHIAMLLQQWGVPILPTETLDEYLKRVSLQECEHDEDWPFIVLLTDFSHAYYQLRFRPWPVEPEARQFFLQARLRVIRQTTNQLQHYRLSLFGQVEGQPPFGVEGCDRIADWQSEIADNTGWPKGGAG
ncbi:MAG: hypothetical protein ETSY2_02190, partial [Candidatus Entotheonella gemina]